MPLQVYEDRPVALATPERPVVHPEHPWRRYPGLIGCGHRLTHPSEHGPRCARQAEGLGHARTSPTAEGEADHLQQRPGPAGTAAVAGSRLRKAFDEDAPLAVGGITEESPHGHGEPDTGTLPGQVDKRADDSDCAPGSPSYRSPDRGPPRVDRQR